MTSACMKYSNAGYNKVNSKYNKMMKQNAVAHLETPSKYP